MTDMESGITKEKEDLSKSTNESMNNKVRGRPVKYDYSSWKTLTLRLG